MNNQFIIHFRIIYFQSPLSMKRMFLAAAAIIGWAGCNKNESDKLLEGNWKVNSQVFEAAKVVRQPATQSIVASDVKGNAFVMLFKKLPESDGSFNIRQAPEQDNDVTFLITINNDGDGTTKTYKTMGEDNKTATVKAGSVLSVSAADVKAVNVADANDIATVSAILAEK
ncbi:MAG TPA: hypothetical protein VL098_01595 [Flavipsychrobacter sp.]|nr:hypothetical protein [Flavipsychrobacter sp.]